MELMTTQTSTQFVGDRVEDVVVTVVVCVVLVVEEEVGEVDVG